MKKLEIFQNKSFGRIRTLAINNEPWFVGKDVAEILGYAKPENAIANHVDEEDKTSTLIQGSGSNYKSKAIIINESGLYSLVLSSKLPSAKAQCDSNESCWAIFFAKSIPDSFKGYNFPRNSTTLPMMRTGSVSTS